MARYPEPPSGKLSGPDGRIVRTLDGHIGVNLETDPDLAADIDWRRNERTFEESDLGATADEDDYL